MKRTLVLMLATLLALLVAVVAPGCEEKKPASLDYDQSPDNVIVEYWAGGGLPAPWDDIVSEFRLFGDGTIIRTDPSSKHLSLIHISEPTRLGMISYAVFCLKKKKKKEEI